MLCIYGTEGLADDREITIKGKSYHAKENTCQDGYLQMSYQPQNSGILLVPDSVKLGEEEQYKNYVMGDYRDKSKEFAQEMDQNFAQILNPEQSTYGKIQVTTQSAIYDDSIGTSAMYIFLGLYLGICFLISGSAVLALKILSDSADSREKYQILQQLGCEEKRNPKSFKTAEWPFISAAPSSVSSTCHIWYTGMPDNALYLWLQGLRDCSGSDHGPYRSHLWRIFPVIP